MTRDAAEEGESLDDLFGEIWERESQPELVFPIDGGGSVVQTQDLQGKRWEVHNFSNTVWEAAIWMHHFFQDERCFPAGWLRGRRVLELGAGTGLVGLSLALLGAEVIMTDLPEALPILRHNTEATFATLAAGGANEDASNRTEAYRRPTILQLCWGDEADAGEVAAAAAAAVEEDDSKWQGFDLIVGADVIYNEPTFPALVSTLSDRRLCSDKTLVYLATMLRGGRHEGLLDMLNGGGFHVRALDPASADDLRASVAGDGNGDHSINSSSSRTSGCSGGTATAGAGASGCCRPWEGPEWRPGNPLEKKKIRFMQAPPAEDDRCSQVTDRSAGGCGAAGSGSEQFDEDEDAGGAGGEDPTRLSAPATKAWRGSTRRLRMPINVTAGGREAERRGAGSWGYEVQGLGKILAFVARRRDDVDGGGGRGSG
eukprot:g14509.t2